MIPISKPIIEKEEIEAVSEVLKSRNLVQGEKVKQFENEFSQYIGIKYGIAVSSGTAALQVDLEALGIKEGDEVITTPFSFIASSNAILYNKAKPIFVDIDSKTFNIDPVKIEEKITPKTKAILIVHLYGLPCEMDKIMRICKEHDLLLIEDCAQAHGAEYNGKRIGSFGLASCFSFYATKNLITGEGGMILTNSKDVAEKSIIIRNQGQTEQYEHVMIGYNFRMTDIQAALGLVQLRKLDESNKKRVENAKFLTENLKNIEWIETPWVDNNVKHAWHQYTIKVPAKERDKFLRYLNENGIGARVYYPKPIHLQPAYQKLGYGKDIYPIAEEISKQVISLPVHPSLTEEDMNKIVEVVINYKKEIR